MTVQIYIYPGGVTCKTHVVNGDGLPQGPSIDAKYRYTFCDGTIAVLCGV